MTRRLLLALVLVSLSSWIGAGEVRAETGSPAQPKPQAKPQAKEAESSWYAATVAEDQRGSFLMVHFWSRGPLFRSEAVLGGRKIVTIVTRDRYIIADAVSGYAISIARSAAAKALDGKLSRPFGNELLQLLAEGGEHVGTEKATGQTVDVYRITDDRGRRTLWMSQSKPPVPLRIETYDRETGTTGKVDYLNWLHNPSIADSFFQPDSGWKIEEISYQEYRERILKGPVGPAPVLYRRLLHGDSDS